MSNIHNEEPMSNIHNEEPMSNIHNDDSALIFDLNANLIAANEEIRKLNNENAILTLKNIENKYALDTITASCHFCKTTLCTFGKSAGPSDEQKKLIDEHIASRCHSGLNPIMRIKIDYAVLEAKYQEALLREQRAEEKVAKLMQELQVRAAQPITWPTGSISYDPQITQNVYWPYNNTAYITSNGNGNATAPTITCQSRHDARWVSI